ncbi:hypothetical protein [Eubacterium limosum]|uniref:hypothetical protein n=1 Tax=Eubacterium limosum TaxID=1736 RepID=UPI0022E1A5A9|nr:hypothetical protein [Eubacterium limosum]
MINLLKMEWYRLRHSRLFGGLLLGIFIAGLFIGVSETEGQAVASAAANGNGGVQLILQMMSEAVPMGFLASIFGVIYLGQGFAERTPNLAVESGSGRLTVFLSKILIYLMVISLAMMVYILAGVMVAAVTLNFTGELSRFKGLQIAVTFFMTGYAMCGMVPLFLAIFRDAAKTTLFSILALMLHIFLAVSGNVLKGVQWCMPLNQMQASGLGMAEWLTAIGIDFAFLVIPSFLGCLIFSKRELK